jgi:NADH:ubiquinone oxidoreductase subunit 3 (subunit A)
MGRSGMTVLVAIFVLALLVGLAYALTAEAFR